MIINIRLEDVRAHGDDAIRILEKKKKTKQGEKGIGVHNRMAVGKKKQAKRAKHPSTRVHCSLLRGSACWPRTWHEEDD